MRFAWMGVALALGLVAGCATETAGGDASGADGTDTAGAPPPGHVADTVVAAPGQTGEGFQDANRAVNGVRGGGETAGGSDVFSLGYRPGVDDTLVLSWGDAWVRNGDGVDFVVFENPFRTGDDRVFMDLAVVFLSRDGTTWVPFPHDYVAQDEGQYVADPAAWPGFAGRHPVRFHVDTNPVDPFDHAKAGGDPFDLDDLPSDDDAARAIREDGFRYLKLVSAPTQINPDTGAPYVRDTASNGPDIDGVIARVVE